MGRPLRIGSEPGNVAVLNAPDDPISMRIMRNIAFNAVGRLWLISTNLLLTPLILSYLGQDRFAVWALFWSLTQYFLLLDMGLGSSLVKYFSEYQSRGDAVSINRILASALLFYLALGAVVVILLWPVVAWIASLFSIPEGLRSEAARTFQVGLVVLFLMNLVSLFDGLLKGFQRMDLVNLTLIVVSIPNLFGSYLVLRLGWGLLGLVTVASIVYLFQLLLLAVQAKIAYPALAWRRQDLRFESLKALFGYGIRFQISQVSQLVSYQADKILLGLFVPLRYVTYYDLGSKVCYLLHDLPHIMLGAVFPAASELAGKEDQGRLWVMFERGTKYLLLFTVPILVGTWLTAHLILQVWLGHVLPDIHLAIMLLSMGYWTVVSMGMVTTIGAGIGWVAPLMRVSLIQGGLNLLLSLALIVPFGYVGVLIGTTVALILSNGYLLVLFCQEFRRSFGDQLRQAGGIFLLNVPPAIVSLLFLGWAAGWVGEGQRGPALLALVSFIILYATSYLITIRLACALDPHDWELLGDYLPMVRVLVRKSG